MFPFMINISFIILLFLENYDNYFWCLFIWIFSEKVVVENEGTVEKILDNINTIRTAKKGSLAKAKAFAILTSLWSTPTETHKQLIALVTVTLLQETLANEDTLSKVTLNALRLLKKLCMRLPFSSSLSSKRDKVVLMSFVPLIVEIIKKEPKYSAIVVEAYFFFIIYVYAKKIQQNFCSWSISCWLKTMISC